MCTQHKIHYYPYTTLEKKPGERKKHLILVNLDAIPLKGGVRNVWFDVLKTFSDNDYNPKGGVR